MVLAESDQSLGIVLPEPAHGPGMVLPESDQERGSAPVSASTPAPLRRALRVGFYDIEGTLGKGNFAVVKLARHRVTRSRVAIKIIDKRRLQPRELQRVHREVLIMKFLNHPHIIKLYQVMETRDMLYIVTEFAQNGEMFEHLSEWGPLSEREAREKFGQLLSAVEYCHRHHIVHRDLKTENMLLDADMNIKLADFGFGNFYRHGEMLSTWCGSPPYAAPEVFEGRDYEGPHLDVWSLGVVLYVLVCGSLPFDGPTLPILRQRVIEGHFRVPFFLSKDCEDLIRRMLTVDPLKRITIPEIKRHCWLTGQAIPHHPPAPPIHGETVNVCSYNYQVLSLMQTLGIDWHKTIESLQNNSYNHFAAIYYLLLERIKEHRQTQAGNRLPSALCPHPQARGGHSQTTALSAAAEHSAMCRDRSMSPRMDCTELRDLSVSPGMECSELRDQSVSPGVECTELRDQSVSPGVECTELRDQSVSPGVECTELRDRSVSPGMECSEFRDQSVSPGMECTELRDLSVSPGMECSEFRDQSMSLGMERSELRDPSASPTGVGVSIAQERGLQLKDNSTGSVMRARSTGCRRHTVAEGLFTPGQQSTPGPKFPRFLCQRFRARAGLRLWQSGELPRQLCPPPYRLAPWDRPAHLLPEWRLSQTMGSHEGPLQSHHVHWQHRELQLAFLGEQEAPPLAPPCAVGAPVLQNAVGSVLQPAAVSLPQAVPSPLSCSLVAFHVPSLLSELLQRQQRLQADCEMEDLAAPCLSKVVLVN